MTENLLTLIQFELLLGNYTLPEHAKWVAVDYDGAVYWYRDRPKLVLENDDYPYWSYTDRQAATTGYYSDMFTLKEGSFPPWSEVMICSVDDLMEK